MDEPGDRWDDVEVVVLLLERPLKTDRRLGLWALGWAVDLERVWTACSGGSFEERVDGGSLLPSSSQARE
jgi:hypothetical protein